jgi:hypothetical protein
VLRRRPRPRLLALAAGLLVVFLAASFVVARWLSTENHERDRLFTLVRAEAAHDPATAIAQLQRCDPACAAKMRGFIARIPAGDDAKLVLVDSRTAHTLGTAEGWTRVVWVPRPTGRPLVQCVRVRRKGGPVTARSVSLLRVTAPLADNEDSC